MEKLIEEHLFKLSALGSKPGLERIEKLLTAMGNPEKQLKFVHVGGTNGKGSTSLIISNVLSMAGYKVGRFISPHIHSYMERFTIDGKYIDPIYLKNYLDKLEKIILDVFPSNISRPTEFEVLTAVALQWFYDCQVDIAVMEVGMGGLYDSTNVITPEVAVITSVDLDHMDFLGNTIEEVAYNKAGIIKNERPVVVGKIPDKAFHVIKNKAFEVNAPLFTSSVTKIIKKEPQGIKGYILDIALPEIEINEVPFSLRGEYQLDNLTTALTAVWVLKEKGYVIDKEHIKDALGQLKMIGRLEVVNYNPLVIVDVAHNPHAAKALSSSLQKLLPNKEKLLLCGIVDDKDARNVLEFFGENTVGCVITRPEGNRGQRWHRLISIWQELYPQKPVYAVEDIEQAVNFAIGQLNKDQYLLICGSFYILDKARRIFTNS